MQLSVKWYGASGRSYNFEVYPLGTDFYPLSGVYIFCRQIASGNWEALYVGETQSFKQRLNTGINSHDGFLRSLRVGATHVAVLPVTGDSQRLGVETDLRHGLKPSANAQNVLRRYS